MAGTKTTKKKEKPTKRKRAKISEDPNIVKELDAMVLIWNQVKPWVDMCKNFKPWNMLVEQDPPCQRYKTQWCQKMGKMKEI